MECGRNIETTEVEKDYDKENAVFSPAGRLYQIEYARICPSGGPLAIGIKCKDGVVLARKLKNQDNIGPLPKKAFEINNKIAFLATGQVIDAYTVSDTLKQSNFESTEDVLRIVRGIFSDRVINRNKRPLALLMLFGSVHDNKPELHVFDVSGTQFSVNAWAIGNGDEDARSFLKEHYEENMTIEEGEKLAILALGKSKNYFVKKITM